MIGAPARYVPTWRLSSQTGILPTENMIPARPYDPGRRPVQHIRADGAGWSSLHQEPAVAGSANADPEASELPPTAARAVSRSLASRRSVYVEEVQRLLDAGLSLMVEGQEAPRVADIVQRSGLSNQAFYRHFASKDELIVAVVESGSARLGTYLEHQVSLAPTPEAQLRAWVAGVLSQATPHVAAPTRAAMTNFRQLPPGHRGAALQPGHDILVGILERLGSPDAERDATTVSTAVFGRLDQFLWTSPPTPGDVEHLVAFCLAAVTRPA
jgi:AcrR family transcriptional regulator